MKTVILSVIALCISGSAMATVVFTPKAGNASACGRLDKIQLSKHFNNPKDFAAPSCYVAGGVKSSTPTINNCKSATDRKAADMYMYDRKSQPTPPACFKPATYVGKAKSWATCTRLEKIEVSKYLTANKAGDRGTLPACYK